MRAMLSACQRSFWELFFRFHTSSDVVSTVFSFSPSHPPDLSEPCEPDAGWALTVTRNKSYLQLQLYH